MKLILLALAIFISCAVAAQNTSITKNIHDNGETISIIVKGIEDDKKINYSNTFNSEHFSNSEPEKLINHVYDSLGVRAFIPYILIQLGLPREILKL
jgi:hypothetical protein